MLVKYEHTRFANYRVTDTPEDPELLTVCNVQFASSLGKRILHSVFLKMLSIWNGQTLIKGSGPMTGVTSNF